MRHDDVEALTAQGRRGVSLKVNEKSGVSVCGYWGALQGAVGQVARYGRPQRLARDRARDRGATQRAAGVAAVSLTLANARWRGAL
jgi:hypothetical protein